MSDSEDSDLEGNSNSDRVGNTDRCGCEDMCLCLRGNISFAINGIFWRKNAMLKILTAKYNTDTLTLPESFSFGNLLCCIHALA